MPTIVLAEDHHVVRQALRLLLEMEKDFRIVGETGNGLEAVELVERLKPNVLVLALMLPGVSGLEITRQVHQRFPETRVVILSMQTSEGYVLEALEAGAIGYVLKQSTSDDLVRAIREAARGKRYLSPPLSERALDAYIQRAKSGTPNHYYTLTPREREVFHLVAKGHTSAEIAQQLDISPRTVEMHRSHIMRKLHLRSQSDLIRYALQRGVLPAE